MHEIWKAIPGYPNYEVSNLGRVRTVRANPPRIKKQTPHWRDGYLRTCLKRSRPVEVHQLVMLAFVGPRPAGLVTRHLDGVKTNNRLENLAYGTPVENGRDCVEHGGNFNASKTECINGHPFDAHNTYSKPGTRHRSCRECNREAVRRYRERRAA